MANQWFRVYSDFLIDTKMIQLAFEDQRHFFGVLALKNDGILDQEGFTESTLDRVVSNRLWIDFAIIKEVKKRLLDVGLIDANWQPLAWERRQYKSDSSAERTRAYRERLKGNIKETSQKRHSDFTDTESDTDTDTDTEKSSRRFTPPTQKEIEQFCSEKSIRIDTGKFFHYYQANGWNVGRKKMKSWQDAIRYWASSEKSPTKQQGKYRLTTEDIYADF